MSLQAHGGLPARCYVSSLPNPPQQVLPSPLPGREVLFWERGASMIQQKVNRYRFNRGKLTDIGQASDSTGPLFQSFDGGLDIISIHLESEGPGPLDLPHVKGIVMLDQQNLDKLDDLTASVHILKLLNSPGPQTFFEAQKRLERLCAASFVQGKGIVVNNSPSSDLEGAGDEHTLPALDLIDDEIRQGDPSHLPAFGLQEHRLLPELTQRLPERSVEVLLCRLCSQAQPTKYRTAMIGERLQIKNGLARLLQPAQNVRLPDAGQTVDDDGLEAISSFLKVGQQLPPPGLITARQAETINSHNAQEAGHSLAAQSAAPAMDDQRLSLFAQPGDRLDNLRNFWRNDLQGMATGRDLALPGVNLANFGSFRIRQERHVYRSNDPLVPMLARRTDIHKQRIFEIVQLVRSELAPGHDLSLDRENLPLSTGTETSCNTICTRGRDFIFSTK